MKRVSVLGVPVDAVTAPELLVQLRRDLAAGKRRWIVTLNNEMLVRAHRDPTYRQTLQRADYRVADTAGVVWAAHFSHHPGGYLRAYWQLLRMALSPRAAQSVLPGTIPGSDLAIELAGMCEEFGHPLCLLGAGPGVADTAAKELQKRFPRLSVAAVEGGRGTATEDGAVRQGIGQAEVVLVAYGFPKQDHWIERSLSKLPKPVVAVGVGGTLDYLAGGTSVDGGWPAKAPPAWVRRRGFEWLWRLFTQPSRWRRIVTAGPVFVRLVVRQHRRQA